MLILFGAIMGFLSLSLSAFIAHGIHLTLTAHQLRSLDTALLNLQVHAILLIALSGYINTQTVSVSRMIRGAACLFVAGTLLFSLSIIFSYILSREGLLLLTPIGGVILLLAWLLLIIGSLVEYRSRSRTKY